MANKNFHFTLLLLFLEIDFFPVQEVVRRGPAAETTKCMLRDTQSSSSSPAYLSSSGESWVDIRYLFLWEISKHFVCDKSACNFYGILDTLIW